MFSKFWSCFSKTQDPDESNTMKLNHVFANRSKEDEIFPLTVKKIKLAQKADPILTYFFKSNAVLSKGLELQLVENESCICHEGKLVIPKHCNGARRCGITTSFSTPSIPVSKRQRKLRYTGNECVSPSKSKTKSCKTCQINKKRSLKYGHLPSK
jgi:hypothetical protein